MKKIVFLLALTALVFTGCKKDEIPDRGQLDPDAMILIRPAQTKSSVVGLTNLEIVEQTLNIKWTSQWSNNIYSEYPVEIGRGFADVQRDLTIPALKMWGTDIITQEGDLLKEFLYGTDVYLTDINNDTIGYVPQSVIDNAKVQIESAYNNQDYNQVYRLFDEAFTFLPIPE